MAEGEVEEKRETKFEMRARIRKYEVETMGMKKPDPLRIRLIEAILKDFNDETLIRAQRAKILALKKENAELRLQIQKGGTKKRKVNDDFSVLSDYTPAVSRVEAVPPAMTEAQRQQMAEAQRQQKMRDLRQGLKDFSDCVPDVQKLLAEPNIMEQEFSKITSFCRMLAVLVEKYKDLMSPGVNELMVDFGDLLRKMEPNTICSRIDPATDNFEYDSGNLKAEKKKDFSWRLQLLADRLQAEITKLESDDGSTKAP